MAPIIVNLRVDYRGKANLAQSTNAEPFAMQAYFTLPGKGVTVLFGASGSGKTTVLRAIAGLERHANTYVSVDAQVWQDETCGIFIPTHQRSVGYVFQEASLFAHLSVKDNCLFGMRRAGAHPPLISFDVVVALLGIESLLPRKPIHLSGGERQRVAIAQTLLSAPTLLLMDEPLAALDRQRAQEILGYLEYLRGTLDIPILYITHSVEELARLADYAVVLDQGKVTASGPLVETMARLETSIQLGQEAGVIVEGSVVSIDEAYGLMAVAFDGATIQVAQTPLQANYHGIPAGSRRQRIRIKARDVIITLSQQTDTSILNQFCAVVVDQVAYEGATQVMVQLAVGSTIILAEITRRSRDALSIAPGKTVWVQVKAVALVM